MPRKPVATFLLHVAFLVALFAFVPGTREVTVRSVHAAGNAMLGSLSGGRSVRFKAPNVEKRRGRADTDMLGRRASRIEYDWRVSFSSYRRLFWPIATLAALIVATPMPRRRLAWALPISLAVFFGYFMLEVAGFAWVMNGAKRPVAAGQSSIWRDAVPVAEAMFNSPITNFSAVFLLWAAFAVPTRWIDTSRFEDLVGRLLGSRRAASPTLEPADEPRSDPAPGESDGSER